MKKAGLFLFLALANLAIAEDHISQGTITKIEASQAKIVLFLTNVSGDPVPWTRGFDNHIAEPTAPYIHLATDTAEVAAKAHLLSMSMAAFSSGKEIRFLWDDAQNRIKTLQLLP